MSKLPKIHHRERVDPGRRFKVERLELEFSNGKKRRYERLHTRGLGAVIVVAMRDTDTFLLVREYAVGLHHYELGLVKGRLEPDETVLEGAQRELQEEIGFAARELTELTSLSLAPGYMTHVTHVVLARDLYPSSLEGDEPEELEVVPWKLSDLHTLVNRPDCTEGRSIAALYIARDYLDKETT
jgi:ADP-ribose diphosphatase